jgi:hypothetical protein
VLRTLTAGSKGNKQPGKKNKDGKLGAKGKGGGKNSGGKGMKGGGGKAGAAGKRRKVKGGNGNRVNGGGKATGSGKPGSGKSGGDSGGLNPRNDEECELFLSQCLVVLDISVFIHVTSFQIQHQKTRLTIS